MMTWMMRGHLPLLMCGLLSTSCAGFLKPKPPPPATVKVATVHFEPQEGQVDQNRQRLVQLTEEAASHGAQIIVHTEMATSGYSFFSREEISKVAEPIPGPSTQALGAVAKHYGVYVAFGLPEYEAKTNLYYNAVALIGPDGKVLGVYRKRNNLLEASYNAEVFAPIPTFDTPYGRLSIVICADMFYSQFPRLAAIAGTQILLAPANVGITTDFVRVRTFENDFSMIVANRFGKGGQGSKKVFFNQDSFTIPSPFPYDFSYDSRSIIMTSTGQVLADLSQPQIAIGYGELPVREQRVFPVVRRPELYSLIGQDTLESYTFSQFGLPPVGIFAAAAVDPGSSATPWDAALASANSALAAAKQAGYTLRLIVYPANYFQAPDPTGLQALQAFSTQSNVDLLLHFGAAAPPESRLLTPSGQSYTYLRTHRARDEQIPLANNYWIIDRDYARVALLQDKDMFAPETSTVMAKLGVDVVAINADTDSSVLSPLWQSRTGDYLHIVVANLHGKEGIYLGGYQSNPSFMEADGRVLMQLNTQHVRSKKEPRFLDFQQMLLPCGKDNC
ncbi:nitrilase-related carbon-nitrogen hydrolase [Hyalangium versicolor]|uniref:nitrilase-related carbon-nitrogen hydrolase n=1 Tax=Hyalangium versicolor TaxID=2861190 RepID=UPI001CC9CAA6|nr:nitrilase-related carbon-nitrogen hydrolase [Hyalangium versicolor]